MRKRESETPIEPDQSRFPANRFIKGTAFFGGLAMVASWVLLIGGVWLLIRHWPTSSADPRTFYTVPPIVGLLGVIWSLVYQVRSFTDVDAKTLQRIDDKAPEEKVVTALDERIGKKENSAFCYYFMEMRNVIENKALGADQKASIQLGYGIWVAGLGVFLYVSSLLIIQHHFEGRLSPPAAVAAPGAVNVDSPQDVSKEWTQLFRHAYLSSAGLFLFVEFLSAWFLKQYRYFQDTAVYLLNLKSVLDKHLLGFLAIQDLGDEKSKQQKMSALLDSLAEPMNWPNSSHISRADVGFAKETMESITEMLRVLRKDSRSKKDISTGEAKETT